MKRHIFHPDAEEEYVDAARYYAAIDPQLASRFYDHIERLIAEVRSDPERYRIFDTPARHHFSRVFPFSVIYLNQPDRIWIVALMHMKRLPGYWKARL